MTSDEVKTRDTLFGKPIYSKTFRFTTTIKGNVLFYFPHNVTDIEHIWIDMQNSFVEGTTGIRSIPFVSCRYNGSSDFLQIGIDRDNIQFDASGGWNEYWTKIVTIRYTKTTDNAI